MSMLSVATASDRGVRAGDTSRPHRDFSPPPSGADETAKQNAGRAAARVLELMATGFIALAPDWTVTYVNVEGVRILGRTREQLLGRSLWEQFPGARELAFGTEYQRTMDTGEPRTFEAFYPGLGVWFEVRSSRTEDGIGVYFLDVTSRHQLEERYQLLGEVSRALADTLDGQVAVSRLAALMVPSLADWCTVTVVDADGSLRDVGFAHSDPQRVGEVAAFSAALDRDDSSEGASVRTVIRDGAPVVLAGISAGVLADPVSDPIAGALRPTSGMVVPLGANGSTLAAMSLWRTGDRAAPTHAELSLAVEVGMRAGMALDNARLYAAQRRFSEVLQHSLLTPPPDLEHVQIVVRYVPATHDVQVGGDWYDAFVATNGATVLAIGDVVGHDTHAAAAMGQVRGLLRGIAFATGAGPSSVLSQLDHAIEGLKLRTLATAVTARLERSTDDHERGVTQMRWSNAGHPPPMVIGPDCQVRHLADGAAPDMMLGVDPDTHRSEYVTELANGTTVFFYTDGLIERRGETLDAGLARLAAALGASDKPLEELCDDVLSRLVTEGNEDDIAVLAIRLTA